MQQVRVHAPNDVRLDEVAEPVPGPRDAVIRVSRCGICGSDVGYARTGGIPGLCSPMPLGHELSGVVEAVGAEVQGLAPGARVVLNPNLEGEGNGGREGGFTPRLLVRNAALPGRLVRIPDALSDEEAALVEPLGVGMHAVDRAQVRPEDKVVVLGAGPIGLAAIATLRDRGVADVVAIDLSPRRLELARKLGARAALDPAAGDPWQELARLHGQWQELGAPVIGSDVYLEASGARTAIPDLLRVAKRRARLAVVALHREETPVRFLDVMAKELSILGAMEYPDDFQPMLDLLARSELAAIITHRLPLARFAEALALAGDPRAGAKVMVEIH